MMFEEFFKKYAYVLQDYLVESGMSENFAIGLNIFVLCIVVGLIALLVDILIRKFIVQTFMAFSTKTENTFDDYLVISNFPKYVAHLFPIGIVWALAPIIFTEFPSVVNFLIKFINVYLVVLCVLIFRSILRTMKNYSELKEKYHDKPIESYVQVLMIFAWGVGIFFILSLLSNFDIKSVATLGATSAVILLIFKDTILGFVASIQVSVNDIVRIGDWITFSKFGADGYVTEINLATVRVQNFDNTFTTIPTYSLIADSFQNWRGMQESKGRRIKRSIFIKQNSVTFLSEEKIEELKKIQLIQPYLEHREKEMRRVNKQIGADKSLSINGRNQTNLGVFRTYAESFLLENELINSDLFLMVRHLAPTDKGIPLEIFCFSYDKTWVNYEHIQADIFDHLIAAVPYFGLEIFESPTGNDLGKINSTKD